MGWLAIKGIGVWGDEPQDFVGDAIAKLLKKMPKRLSINDIARMKRMLVADRDLKAKCDKVYLREWNRPMNQRELSRHVETGLSTAFCHPDVYRKNPAGEHARSGKLVARWETRGKKYWYELYEAPGGGSFFYRMDNGGGNLGYMTKVDAIKLLERRMDDARRIDGINYKGVYVAILNPSLRRMEGENWNKQRAWAYNHGFMDARNNFRNGKEQYLLGAAYDQGYRQGKRGMKNPISSFPSISDTYYILLNNLYLDIQAGRKPMNRGNYNLLMAYLNGAYDSSDWDIREWWYEEFQKLPGWINVNPIVGTIGLGLLSGVGLGVGFSIVNWGKKKLLQNNPRQQLVFHKGTKRDGCRKIIEPGERVANRWGRILCSRCDAKKGAPSLAVYSVGVLRPEIFQALGRRKLQCGDTLISQK